MFTITFSSSQGSVAQKPKVLAHGFRAVTPVKGSGRDSFTLSEDSPTSRIIIKNVPTLMIPGRGRRFLALDYQPLPSGRGCCGDKNDILMQGVRNLPPSLQRAGKGVLIIGDPARYLPSEIEAIADFSRSMPRGVFAGLLKDPISLAPPIEGIPRSSMLGILKEVSVRTNPTQQPTQEDWLTATNRDRVSTAHTAINVGELIKYLGQVAR